MREASSYSYCLWGPGALTLQSFFQLHYGLTELSYRLILIHNDLDQPFFCALFVLGCLFHTSTLSYLPGFLNLPRELSQIFKRLAEHLSILGPQKLLNSDMVSSLHSRIEMLMTLPAHYYPFQIMLE